MLHYCAITLHAPLPCSNTPCSKCTCHGTSVLVQGMPWPTSNPIASAAAYPLQFTADSNDYSCSISIAFVYVRNVISLNLVCLWASSRPLKPYSLEVLFVNEVMCSDKANGLLLDLHCCKDILLVPLSWGDGSRLWFCRVLSQLSRSLDWCLCSP